MPSLRPGTPGAKEAFGISIVNEKGEVIIPPAAVQHYGFEDDLTVLLSTTHRKESGFAVLHKERAEKSVFKRIIKACTVPEKVYWQSEKAYVLTQLQGGKVVLNPEMLDAYYIECGMRLMTVKSTTIALSFTPAEIWAEKFRRSDFADAAEQIEKLPVFL